MASTVGGVCRPRYGDQLLSLRRINVGRQLATHSGQFDAALGRSGAVSPKVIVSCPRSAQILGRTGFEESLVWQWCASMSQGSIDAPLAAVLEPFVLVSAVLACASKRQAPPLIMNAQVADLGVHRFGVCGQVSAASVNVAPMSDADDEDDQCGVVDLVDDAVVADPNTPRTRLAGERLDARRAWVVGGATIARRTRARVRPSSLPSSLSADRRNSMV